MRSFLSDIISSFLQDVKQKHVSKHKPPLLRGGLCKIFTRINKIFCRQLFYFAFVGFFSAPRAAAAAVAAVAACFAFGAANQSGDQNSDHDNGAHHNGDNFYRFHSNLPLSSSSFQPAFVEKNYSPNDNRYGGGEDERRPPPRADNIDRRGHNI